MVVTLNDINMWFMCSDLTELWLWGEEPFLTLITSHIILCVRLCATPPSGGFCLSLCLCPVECSCLLQTRSCHLTRVKMLSRTMRSRGARQRFCSPTPMRCSSCLNGALEWDWAYYYTSLIKSVINFQKHQNFFGNNFCIFVHVLENIPNNLM